jgi:hypothetical protein
MTRILLLALLFVGVASAAQAATTDPAPLTFDQQKDAAVKLVTAGNNIVTRLRGMLSEARKVKDGIKLVECLNAKVNEALAQMNSLNAAHGEFMKPGVDKSARKYKFDLMGVIGAKLRQVEQGADACDGDDVSETSRTTRVVTEIDQAMLPFEHSVGFPEGSPTLPVPVPPAGSDEE